MINIYQKPFDVEIKDFIFNGFSKYSVDNLGYDGAASRQEAFIAFDENKIIGALSTLNFFGALWLKYFYINPEHRGNGVGTRMIESALEYGRKLKLDFAFVETLSFQAPKFYIKLGFELEFTRGGYKDNVSFHYLQKKL